MGLYQRGDHFLDGTLTGEYAVDGIGMGRSAVHKRSLLIVLDGLRYEGTPANIPGRGSVQVVDEFVSHRSPSFCGDNRKHRAGYDPTRCEEIGSYHLPPTGTAPCVSLRKGV